MENIPGNIPDRLRFTLKKEERLCSRKLIGKLFAAGSAFLIYPLKVVHLEMDATGTFPVKAGFAVGTKNFKRAVRRNLIKRRMREAYRLNKHLLVSAGQLTPRAVMFIYVGKKVFDYHTIEKSMVRSLSRIASTTPPNP
jgi:ribonuclease P protein component